MSSFRSNLFVMLLGILSVAYAAHAAPGPGTVPWTVEQSHDDMAQAYFNRAIDYYRDKDYASAARDFEKALAIWPESYIIYLDLGVANARLQHYDEAVKDYDQAIALQPIFPDAFLNRSIAKEHLGQYPEAVADVDQALQLRPYFANALSERCWLRAVWGRELDRALDDCKAALQIDDDSAEALGNRGVVEYRLAEYPQALSDFNESVRRDDRAATSFYFRGLTKRRLNDRDGGDADIEIAHKLDPNIDSSIQKMGL